MAYQFRGWTSTVIEIAYEFNEEGWQGFLAEVSDNPRHMFATVLSPAGGGPPMAPMVEGQEENQLCVRIESPNSMLSVAVAALEDACRRHFPRSPKG